ncbi:MAG TPA: 4Fe-4S dicluster domain-containing protein [Bacteroidales bacterium]|nr:4Fe-4S dicluster domain-containing protein [Bacteroidales bacterium]
MGPKGIDNSRRKFIRNTALAAGGALTAFLTQPAKALVIAAGKPADPGTPWYGIGIDIDKCIGCGRCARACKIENDVPDEPFYFRSWVEQYTIKNDGEVVIEAPNGGVGGFTQSVPDEEIFKSFFVPKMCNQCYKSPCEQVCPVGATYLSPEGAVLVDKDHCIGCRYCIQACPYGCRYIHPEKKVVDKCNLCYHRITKGMQPACFEVCPTGARIFGDLNDREGELVAFIREHNCQVLKPHLNTGSKLFYNSLSSEVK